MHRFTAYVKPQTPSVRAHAQCFVYVTSIRTGLEKKLKLLQFVPNHTVGRKCPNGWEVRINPNKYK